MPFLCHYSRVLSIAIQAPVQNKASDKTAERAFKHLEAGVKFFKLQITPIIKVTDSSCQDRLLIKRMPFIIKPGLMEVTLIINKM